MIVPYDRPRGAIHSLPHLQTLSDARCKILCISERTLYILLNYAAIDIEFEARFAEELLETGYNAVNPDSPLFELFQEVVNNFQLEVTDMSCDIQTGLEAIAQSLSEIAASNRGGGGGGSCGSYGYVAPCISDLTNDEILGPGESTQGDPGSDPPPEGFDSWEDYFEYKCQAAHYIHQFLVNLCTVTTGLAGLQLISAIVTPIIAGAAGILPAAFTPAGFVIFVGAILAIGVISTIAIVEVQQIRSYLVSNERDVICALYNSQNTVQAVSAVSGLFEDAIQAIVWPEALIPVSGQLNNLLALMFSQVANNGTVESLFKLYADVQFATANCDDCNGGTPYAQTAQTSPYNVLVVGDSVNYSEQDTDKGYKGTNNNQYFDLEFHVDDGYTDLWQYDFEYQSGPGDPQTLIVSIQYWNGSIWQGLSGGSFSYPIADGSWTPISETDIDVDFLDSTQYRFHAAPQDFNESGWFRKFNLKAQ